MANNQACAWALGSAEPPGVRRSSNDEERVVECWDRDIRRAARSRSSRLGGGHEPSDLAQEARIRLVLVVRSGKEAAPYLRTVISNAVLAAAKKGRVREEQNDCADELAADVPDPEVNDTVEAVAGWVAGLPRRLKAVYRALYAEELTQREAAKILRVSQPRVAQLHRELLELGRRDLRHLAA